MNDVLPLPFVVGFCCHRSAPGLIELRERMWGWGGHYQNIAEPGPEHEICVINLIGHHIPLHQLPRLVACS